MNIYELTLLYISHLTDKAQTGHSEYAQPDNAGDAQGGGEHGTFIPIIASLDSNNSSQESSSDKNNKESDKQTIYYDASKDGLVNSEENKMLRKVWWLCLKQQ